MVTTKAPKKVTKSSVRRSKKRKVTRRGKSKLTLIQSADAPRDKIQAFRCDETVHQFLASLPSGEKSNFIIEALYKAIAKFKPVTCPTCKGHGMLGPNVNLIKS